MSVIAKLQVNGYDRFPNGAAVAATVVCENSLMAQYAPENEDVLFTKASPCGDARFEFNNHPDLVRDDKLYVVFVKGEASPDGAIAWVKNARIASINDMGGTTKHVEISGMRENYQVSRDRELTRFIFRIGIDNPGAYNQFKAGESGWTVLVYRALDVTLQDALALAHRVAVPVDAAEEQA